MDLVTLVAAFGASKKYTDSLGSGITNIQVSPDGTSLIFTTTNGSTFTISVEDWNAITLAEKEKINKIVVSGDGDLFLSNDGSYKIPSGGNSNYNMLSNKPSINGNQLLGDKNGTDLGFSTVATTGSYNDLSNKPTIPTLVSQLSNDSGFVLSTVDNLVNYYLKSDTYTKVEVNGLIGNIASIDVQIVTVLPTENISLTTIYLIQIPETTNYNQWMYINSIWANIGSTSVDLSNYYNKTEIDTLLNGKVDKITGYGLSQENYTTVEKTKLAGLNNYTPPIATTETLGQVMVDGISIYVDENGVISAAAGGGGLPPNNVSGLSIESGLTTLTIKWSDPSDIIVDGQTISTWKGTKLLYKTTGYPISPFDGTLAVDNQVRDTYSATGFTINGLSAGTYYIKLFPYNSTNAYNISDENQIMGTIITYETITAIIDISNSNPSTCVTYADGAIDMIAGSNAWDEWFGIYPCLFKDGQEIGRLNPNDFSKFEDGSPADITSGNSGDVMIAFPRRGLKISKTGNYITINMTRLQNDNNFNYYAHTRGNTNKDVFYCGCYKSYILSSKLRSLSNKTPSANVSIGNFRTYAHNNGNGYEIFSFYQLIFIQSMFILKYKNLNSQQSIGNGWVSAAVSSTGKLNNMGMNYGVSSTNGTIKLFGIEDMWGNLMEFIDGFYRKNGSGLYTTTDNFGDAASYNLISTFMTYLSGYVTDVAGTSNLGFFVNQTGGSNTTYFCDFSRLNPSPGGNTPLVYGSSYVIGTNIGESGIFCAQTGTYSMDNVSIYIGSRLMFL